MNKPKNEIAVDADVSKSGWQWASWQQWVIVLACAAAVVGLDQLSKWLVTSNLARGEIARLIDPILWIVHSRNPDAIFSISLGPKFIYFILPLIAIGFVVYLLLRPQSRYVTVLLGIIVGGGLGNLIDRIRLGEVVDWISMGLSNTARFATFNVADSSVVVSVILILIYEFFFSPSARKKKEPAESQAEDSSP